MMHPNWIDVLNGERLARGVASVAFMVAFFPQAWGYARSAFARKRASSEDRLALGVGCVALATLVYNVSGVVQNYLGHDTPLVSLFVVADGLMLFGYYHALVAWRGAYRGRMNGSMWKVGVTLLAAFLVGGAASSYLAGAR